MNKNEQEQKEEKREFISINLAQKLLKKLVKKCY